MKTHLLARRGLTSLSFALAFAALQSAALAANVSEDKTISVNGKGGVGFAVDGEGQVVARVTVPKMSTVEVFGPSGSKGKKAGTGVVEIIVPANVVATELATSKLWSVTVTTEAGQTFAAPAHLEHGGKSYKDDELLKLVSAQTAPANSPPSPVSAPPGVATQISAVKAAAAKFSTGTVQLKAIGSGAFKRATAPLYTPKPIAVGTAASAGTAPNSYGGSSSTPSPPSRTWVQVNSVTISGDPNNATPHNCPTTCALTAGETLTILTAPGLAAAGHEVHFVSFADNSDQTVVPVVWADNVVVVQVPRFSGSGNVDGAIYLGTPNSSVQSTFYGFHYVPNAPTIVSQMVHWYRTVPDGVPTSVQVRRTQSFAWPETTTVGSVDDGDFFSVLRSSYIGTSGAPFDLFFNGYHLANGWKVKRVHFISHSISVWGGYANLIESHVGTDDMTTKVEWGYSANGGITFQVGWEIEGPDNTNPFQ